jgi:hypothetical protein
MIRMFFSSTPFALSLSKGCPSFFEAIEGQGFDRLSPNGTGSVRLMDDGDVE